MVWNLGDVFAKYLDLYLASDMVIYLDRLLGNYRSEHRDLQWVFLHLLS